MNMIPVNSLDRSFHHRGHDKREKTYKTMMRSDIQINLLWFAIVVEFCSLQNGVLGFQYHPASSLRITQSPNNKAVCCWSTTNHRSSFPEDRPPPTVHNPITKRKIHLGGPTFSDFLKQGKFVQHEGTLKRLDLEALRDYQQGSSNPTADQPDANQKTPCYREESDREITTMDDEWYCITPRLVVSSQKKSIATSSSSTLPLDQAEVNLLRQQLLFVNKPSGLHCVPPRDLSFDSLSSQVSSSLHCHAKPCHRLDRDTSGLVIFGITADAHRDISKQFEARTTSKTYIALIAGIPSHDEGIIDLPIGKVKTMEGFNRWAIGGEKAREAITKWRVEETFTDGDTGAKFSRVELEPKTGRGHQLRLHMKAIGHPILGDTLHGEGGVASCSPRLCLHALKLQVDWNGQRLQAESVAPF
jgi:tRNA pseudouridine32 synthase/23S rRNA pseudouridine746 synthase